MKRNLKLVCLFLAIAGMVSCSKDDDGGEKSSDNLVGTWNATSVTQNNLKSIEVDLKMVFNADKKFSINGDFTLAGTDGTGVKMESFDFSGTYTRDGDNISIDSVFGEEIMKILQNDKTTLKLEKKPSNGDVPYVITLKKA